MLKSITFLFVSIVAFALVSCKNDTQETTKNDVVTVDATSKAPIKKAAKKELTPDDIALIKSVLARVMTEPQLKKFASYLVTAQLTDQLSSEDKNYIVFGPSDTAIDALSDEKKKFYSNPENFEKLVEMLKTHIVSEGLDEKTLEENLENNGKLNLKTLAGVSLTVTKSGDNIMISDGKGKKVTVVKNSVKGGNGSVFVVDGLLNAD